MKEGNNVVKISFDCPNETLKIIETVRLDEYPLMTRTKALIKIIESYNASEIVMED